MSETSIVTGQIVEILHGAGFFPGARAWAFKFKDTTGKIHELHGDPHTLSPFLIQTLELGATNEKGTAFEKAPMEEEPTCPALEQKKKISEIIDTDANSFEIPLGVKIFLQKNKLLCKRADNSVFSEYAPKEGPAVLSGTWRQLCFDLDGVFLAHVLLDGIGGFSASFGYASARDLLNAANARGGRLGMCMKAPATPEVALLEPPAEQQGQQRDACSVLMHAASTSSAVAPREPARTRVGASRGDALRMSLRHCELTVVNEETATDADIEQLAAKVHDMGCQSKTGKALVATAGNLLHYMGLSGMAKLTTQVLKKAGSDGLEVACIAEAHLLSAGALSMLLCACKRLILVGNSLGMCPDAPKGTSPFLFAELCQINNNMPTAKDYKTLALEEKERDGNSFYEGDNMEFAPRDRKLWVGQMAFGGERPPKDERWLNRDGLARSIREIEVLRVMGTPSPGERKVWHRFKVVNRIRSVVFDSDEADAKGPVPLTPWELLMGSRDWRRLYAPLLQSTGATVPWKGAQQPDTKRKRLF